MGIRSSVLMRAAVVCAVALVVALLALPGVAFAADAKFYYKKPVASSTTTTDMPKITVYIVDRYGIKYSSNFRIYVDGVRKTPKISYKSRYKKIWLSYATRTKYKAGTHKITVKVKNVRGHWSTTYWYFKVPKFTPPTPPQPPAPEPMPVTIESSQCHACHLDTSWHPMNDCQQCHGAGRPVSWSTYTPADTSAHTVRCAMEPCHGAGGAFPHSLWSDCSRCHNGSYEGVASSHAVEAEPAHLSASVLCTRSGCHLKSLTLEHYRRTVGGVKFTCATCHSSTDQRVRLALETRSTRCESCHPLTTAHVAPTALHTVSGGCVLPGCHGSSAIAIHGAAGGPGCAACHASSRTASLVCANCHPGDVSSVHESAVVSHTAVNATCITSLCHAADVAALHGKSTGPGCAACHGIGKTPSTSCPVCHPGTVESLHPNVGPDHTAPVGGCVTTSCHRTNVMDLHNGTGVPGCGACHKAGTTATIVCTTCHTGDVEQVHPGLATKHAAGSLPCALGGCHGTSASAIHSATGGPGCAACHAEGKTPSTWCASCHASDPRSSHVNMAARHAATVPGCVLTGCHASDAGTLHAAVGCAICHATSGATIACATCHGTVPRSQHAFAATAHLAPAGSCISSLCHVNDVITLHSKAGGPGCAACHANGKTPSLTCTACHSGDMESVHPNIGVAHTAPASGCVGAKCHLTNVTTIHGATDGPGCGACHLAGRTPTLTCASCHPGDLGPRHPWAAAKHTGTNPACQTSTCHVTDVAVTHATGLGCVDCHGPGRTASTACASCHPADIASIHTSAAAKHTASAGTCVSSVCHVTSATTLHKTLTLQGCPTCHAPAKTPTLACRTCHTTTLVSLHAIVAATPHTAPTSTCVQTGCHGSNVATLHSALAGEGCASCHIPGRTLTQACTTCHNGDLTPRHPSATAAHTAPASSCVTGGCHASDVGTLHSKTGGPGCAACHAPGKTPSLTCANCHTDGAGLHPGAAAAHTATLGTCVHTGCHVTDAAWLHTQLGGPGCAACHVTGKTPTLVCVTCHTGDLTPRHSFADTAHSAPAGTCVGPTCHVSNVSTTHATGLGCVDCHGIGKTPSLLCGTCHTAPVLPLHPQAAGKHTAAAGLCTSCHGTDSAAAHSQTGGPGCIACHAAGKTPSTSCSACHSATFSIWHSAPAAKHTAPTGGCVTGGCHVADAVALHTKVGGPGCAACHAIGKSASLTCTACHAGDMSALHPNAAISHTGTGGCQGANCHASDVSSVHGANGGPGCTACHAAGKTASVTCYNCHVGIATVHADGTVPHTVVNACTNATCHVHSTSATTLHRYSSRGCRACHTPGVTATASCSTCHPGDETSVHVVAIGSKHTAAYGSCITTVCHNTDVASLHTKIGGPGCGACHAVGITPSLVCANCHTSGFPPTHPAPVSAHTSTTEACIQPGCHASNAATLHTAAGGPGCAACHSAGVTATLNCVTCHHLGLADRHPSGAVPHAVNEHPCTASNCHGGNAVTIHEQDQWSCWVCHDNDTGQAATNACADCHPYSWASRHAVAAQVTDYHGGGIGTGYTEWGYYSDGYIKAPYTRGWRFTCADCHVPTGTTNVFDFPLVINGMPVTVNNRQTQLQNMCIACHGGSLNDWHAGCISCHAGGMGIGAITDFTGQDCSRCHQHGMQGWPHSIWSFQGPTL